MYPSPAAEVNGVLLPRLYLLGAQRAGGCVGFPIVFVFHSVFITNQGMKLRGLGELARFSFSVASEANKFRSFFGKLVNPISLREYTSNEVF